jgi:NADPH:quinone reductase
VKAITENRGVQAMIELDLGVNAKLLPEVLAPNAVVAIYGSSSQDVSVPFQFLLQNSIALKFFLVYEMPSPMRGRATAEITRMLARGELIHNVAQTFALDEIAAAHEAVESGRAMGNVVVRLG